MSTVIDNIVPPTTKKDNDPIAGLFTLGKPADDTSPEKNKDRTSKGRNKDRNVTGGKK